VLLPPFRHQWTPIGGIPFHGVPGVWTNGCQQLHCLDCGGEKWHWPWPEDGWTPSPGETFGYRT
jgi:hypothetical protein